MNALFQDIRYALRQLRKSPAFTLTAAVLLTAVMVVLAAIVPAVAPLPLNPCKPSERSNRSA